MSSKNFKYLCTFLIIAIFVFGYLSPINASSSSQIPDLLPAVERARHDFPLVKELVKNFSSMGSRFTTYPGFQNAAKFIEKWFKKYLVDVEVHTYNLTVIVDRGASLTVHGSAEHFKLYPLVPNAVIPVHTPRGGTTGPVVHVGSGELTELDGKPIRGAIVLMDFNSEAKWLDVAKLGAAAVIFIEPSYTIREEAFNKYLDRIPLNFPRLYIRQDEAARLLSMLSQRDVTATLTAESKWEIRQAVNIMGWVKGRKYPNEHVIIGTYFDAYSVVPSMATGASEACSISSLLALAKYYSENPPLFSVLFLALSGHNQGLIGEKEWIEKYMYGPDRMNLEPPFRAYWRNESVLQGTSTGFWEAGKGALTMLGIDIWPETTQLYPMPEGGYYPHSTGLWSTPLNLDIVEVYNQLKKQTGKDYGLIPNGWMQYGVLYSALTCSGVGGPLSIVSGPNYFRWKPFEVINFQGGTGGPLRGAVFSTGRAWCRLYGTPVDTYEQIEPELVKLGPQLELMFAWLHFYLNTEALRPSVPRQPGTRDNQGRTPLEQWHRNYIPACFLPIEVVTWNPFSAWYDPIHVNPNQTILIQGFSQEVSQRSYRTAWISKVMDDGTFMAPAHPWYEGQISQRLVAYVLDENNSLIYISDIGPHSMPIVTPMGAVGVFVKLGFYAVFEPVKISVFRCSSAVIFGLDDPAYLDLPSFSISRLVSINYFDSHTPVEYFNVITENIKYGYNLGAILFEPDVPIEVLMTKGFGQNLPDLILNNANDQYPQGRGYTLRAGEQIRFSIFNFTQGFYYTDAHREILSRRAGIVEPYAKAHAEVTQEMEETLQSLSDYNYSRSYLKAVEIWRKEIFAYLGFRNVIEGAIQTVPFFAATLIPVAFIIERLLFTYEGRKRILTVILMCGAILAAFSLLHPGFTLASNVVVVLVSFAIFVLVTPAIALLYGRILDYLKRVRRKVLGPHFAEITRSSIFVTSVSIGIANMKKRRLRTTLALIPIIIVSMSIVMISEVSVSEEVKPALLGEVASLPYEGILIEREHFGQSDSYLMSVGVKMLQYLENKFGRTGEVIISPRIWVYPIYGGGSTTYAGWLLESSKPTEYVPYVLRALIGLTPQEDEITHISLSFSEKFQNSRWFLDTDVWAIMIHERVAEDLGITALPAKVSLSGVPLTVVGVYSDKLYHITDINFYKLLIPIDFSLGPPEMSSMESRHVAIIPYRLATMMAPYFAVEDRYSAWIIDVALKPKNPDEIFNIASQIYQNFRGTSFNVWISYKGSVSLAATKMAVTVTGGLLQVVPIILAALIILNTLIGAVVERRREIETLSTVGLSPTHIAGLFLAESLVYALIGGIIGYISAMFITTLTLKVFYLPLALNYASSWVVIALGLAMFITLASSLYPTWIAARLVAPSQERRWVIPTKPYRDAWDIPLPFIANSQREAGGMLSYLREYMSQHMSPVAPDFSVMEITPVTRGEVERKEMLSFDAVLMITPYEVGIIQKITLQALEQIGERWNFHLNITRRQGEVGKWVLLNRTFITFLREQFLIWRTLKDQEKEEYMSMLSA